MTRRLPPLLPAEMTAAQKDVFDAITTGARAGARPASYFTDKDGGLAGPFNAFAWAPTTGAIAQSLGETLRYKAHLDGQLREIAILCVALHWQADFEWYAHAKAARTEGVEEADLDALLKGLPLSSPAFETIRKATTEILDTKRLSDDTYQETDALLGTEGIAELTTLIGYYCLISITLNVFNVDLPEGETSPFSP